MFWTFDQDMSQGTFLNTFPRPIDLFWAWAGMESFYQTQFFGAGDPHGARQGTGTGMGMVSPKILLMLSSSAFQVMP